MGSEIFWEFLTIFGFICFLYALYYKFLSYFKVTRGGDKKSRRKKLGKTLPPFPNGWYIACKSSQLLKGYAKSIKISGHSFTLFRNNQTNTVYGLESYCAHSGANMGVGGIVINQKCLQCPFHGWLYDGQTGICVDYGNRPVKLKKIKYQKQDNQQSSNVKLEDCSSKQEQVKLRKYQTIEQHGFIYVWIHNNAKVKSNFNFINVEKHCKKLKLRGETIHYVNCHIQDIPENGADVFHFKYVHKYPIAGISKIYFEWYPQWKKGDDPQIKDIFKHPIKNISKFKTQLYTQYFQNHCHKQYLSVGSIDNYIVLPIIGRIFLFNLTVIQMGPGLVYVFLKTQICSFLFIQYIQTVDTFEQVLHHSVYTSSWLPYWVSALAIYGQAHQVANDMMIWNMKKFPYQSYCKPNEADKFIKEWRIWMNKNYQGCTYTPNDLSW